MLNLLAKLLSTNRGKDGANALAESNADVWAIYAVASHDDYIFIFNEDSRLPAT